MRGESDGVTERKEQDMEKDQNKSRIAISMFNWGPCVIRLKINEDFQNKLLEEAKKNKEDILVAIGIIINPICLKNKTLIEIFIITETRE